MRQMEEKIQSLTKNLQDLQSTLDTMNERFQQEVSKPGFIGGGGSSISTGRNPADAAQPEIKETIHSIQTKLDQLDNRTQASVLRMMTIDRKQPDHSQIWQMDLHLYSACKSSDSSNTFTHSHRH